MVELLYKDSNELTGYIREGLPKSVLNALLIPPIPNEPILDGLLIGGGFDPSIYIAIQSTVNSKSHYISMTGYLSHTQRFPPETSVYHLVFAVPEHIAEGFQWQPFATKNKTIWKGVMTADEKLVTSNLKQWVVGISTEPIDENELKNVVKKLTERELVSAAELP